MAKSTPSGIIAQLDELVDGQRLDVSKIKLPHRLTNGTPEYAATKRAIAKLRQKGETKLALKLARKFVAAAPNDRKVKLQLARILWADYKYKEAASLLDKMGSLGPDHEWLSVRAAVYDGLGDTIAAVKLTEKFRHAAPMVMTQRHRNDLPILAVLNVGPNKITIPVLAAQRHFSGNFISQFASRITDKFRFASYWVNAQNLEVALRSSPTPEIVLNNAASGEIAYDPDIAPQLENCLSYWNKPCINAPEDVRGTARDKLAAALSGSQRILAPKTLYMHSSDNDNEMADQVEQEFEYPLILREPYLQNGSRMYLVEDREESLKVIPTLRPGFFAIEFINNLHPGNMYRKMRGAFIKDEFFMLRVDYGPDWMIHGHRDQAHRVEFYNDNPQYIEEEIAICKDPAREFGKPVMRALRELRSTIKLDYFGVDFDISSDGKMIVYEANSAMNFLSKSGLVHPHPEEPGDALIESFTKLLMSRIDRPKMAMMR